MNKVLKWSGLGSVDKLFGLFFGAFKGYAYFIILFTISNAIHPVDNWHKSLNSGIFYENIEYGKEFLVNNFSNRQEYFDDGKDKIDKISKWQIIIIGVLKLSDSAKKIKWRMWYFWSL